MFFKLQIVIYWLILQLHKAKSRASLLKLQQKRWRKFQKVLHRSPFYQAKSLHNTTLQDYPVMNKASFMGQFDQINTQGIQVKEAYEVALGAEESRDFSPEINGITVGLSSGTSGNRGIFLASKKERAFWVAAVLDRVIGFSLKKRRVAFFLRANSNLYSSVKSRVLSFDFFDLYDTLAHHVQRLNQLKPNILVAQPSMLLDLAQEIQQGRLHINPQKIISVAEVLYPEDKALLEVTFGQMIHQVYQCTEGFLASTCAHGTLHFNEDFLMIEKKYLDDSKTRFHPIITDLKRSSQPIVRYELNDIIQEKTDCACGSPMMGIAQIEGRSDDVLVFENTDVQEVRIYPDFFRRAIITADDAIQDYTLVQRNANLLELYLQGSEESFQKAKQGIEVLLVKYQIDTVNIVRTKIKHHEQGNKLRRIKYEKN
ncbi:hypothetical protein BKI52_21285 [marine bacterium AO1-C]|nr:hypothetical protein BKI52_21285 [marine bacterium AO1-C]